MLNIGIKAGETATTKLAFRPSMEINDGLNIASLEVTLINSKISEDAKWVFAGKEVPVLTFHFMSDKEPRAHYFESFKVIDISDYDKIKTIADSMIKKIHHMMEAAEIKQEVIEDILVNGLQFENTEVDHVISVFKGFFTKIEAAFNGSTKNKTKSVLIVDDKPVLFWLKLIRDYERNKGKLGLPFFPGEGFLQKFVKGVKPTIKLDVTKGETIRERENSNQPQFGANPNPNINNSAIPDAFRGM